MRRRRDRRTVRLQSWDYTSIGCYFVTIQTCESTPLFATIREAELQLTAWGEIVRACWDEIPTHFEHVRTDAFVIMPTHVHGIIVITTEQCGSDAPDASEQESHRCRDWPATLRNTVGSRNKEQFSRPVRGSLATIVRSFKAAVTRRIRNATGCRTEQVWQSRFYEHVVRSAGDLARIRRYISKNPERWIEKHGASTRRPPRGRV